MGEVVDLEAERHRKTPASSDPKEREDARWLELEIRAQWLGRGGRRAVQLARLAGFDPDGLSLIRWRGPRARLIVLAFGRWDMDRYFEVTCRGIMPRAPRA